MPTEWEWHYHANVYLKKIIYTIAAGAPYRGAASQPNNTPPPPSGGDLASTVKNEFTVEKEFKHPLGVTKPHVEKLDFIGTHKGGPRCLFFGAIGSNMPRQPAYKTDRPRSSSDSASGPSEGASKPRWQGVLLLLLRLLLLLLLSL